MRLAQKRKKRVNLIASPRFTNREKPRPVVSRPSLPGSNSQRNRKLLSRAAVLELYCASAPTYIRGVRDSVGRTPRSVTRVFSLGSEIQSNDTRGSTANRELSSTRPEYPIPVRDPLKKSPRLRFQLAAHLAMRTEPKASGSMSLLLNSRLKLPISLWVSRTSAPFTNRSTLTSQLSLRIYRLEVGRGLKRAEAKASPTFRTSAWMPYR